MKRFGKKSYPGWFLGIILFLMFPGATYFYLPSLLAEVRNPVAAWFNPSLKTVTKPDLRAVGIAHYDQFKWPVDDSIRLAGYICFPEGIPKGTVIALHGYRSNKNRFLPAAGYFTKDGWNFVAVDLRGHNQSDGTKTGFSYYERYDISVMMDSLERKHFPRPYVLYGHSIGAATAVFVAGHRQDIDALILESAFDDFSNLIPNYWNYYASKHIPLPNDVCNALFARIQLPLDSLRPVDIAPRIHVPVIQVQGMQDRKVKPEQAESLFRTFATDRKYFISIPQGNHNRLWLPDEKNYFRTLLSRLDSLMEESTTVASEN